MIRDAATMDRPVDDAPRLRRRFFGGTAILLFAIAAGAVIPPTRRWSQAEHRVDASRLRPPWRRNKPCANNPLASWSRT